MSGKSQSFPQYNQCSTIKESIKISPPQILTENLQSSSLAVRKYPEIAIPSTPARDQARMFEDEVHSSLVNIHSKKYRAH